MSSDSDYHSSSSPVNRTINSPSRKVNRSRSRSRDRRRDHDRDDYRNKRIRFKVPELNGYLISYKSFIASQTDRISEEMGRKAYDRYRRDWEEKQNESFLAEYKNDAWFREKYDPEILDVSQRERKENVKKRALNFFDKFNQQYFSNINLAINDPASLGYVMNQDRTEEEQTVNNNLINVQSIQISLNSAVEIGGQPYFGFDQDKHTIFIKCIPRTVSRYDIYGLASKLDGFVGLTLSDPVKKLNFSRYCWVQFNNEDTLKKAQLSMNGLIIKNQPLVVSKSFSKSKRVKVLKNYPKSRIEIDSITIHKLASKLDEQCGIQDNPLYNHAFSSLNKKFDTFLLYLRRVHAYDYFTSVAYENQRAMSIKLGLAFLRIQAQYEQITGYQTIFTKIQENAEKIIEKGSEIFDYLGMLREQIQKFIRQAEKISKDQMVAKQFWKCLYCDKKFKTCEFLAKHMISKHSEIRNKKIQVLMQQSYMKDPNKMTIYPFRVNDDRDGIRFRRSFGRQNHRRRQNFKDWDEPQGQKAQKVATKTLVNFLDI